MELTTLERRPVLPAGGSGFRQPTAAPDTGLGAVATGLETAASEVAQVAYRQKREDDAAELAGLSARLTEWQTSALYDPQKGAVSRKGKDAFDLGQTYLPQYDKFAGELSKGITSGDVRRAFDRLVADERGQVGRSLAIHERTERTAYNTQQTQAMLLAQDNLVGSNPFDAEVARRAIGMKGDAVRAAAAREGWSPEALDQALLGSESSVHKARIMGMVGVGRYSDASTYFAGNRDRLTAQDAAAVDGPVREGMVRSESLRQADDLVAKHGAGAGALSAARGIEDPDVRKAVESDIRQRISDARAMQNIAEEQAADRAWDIVEKTGDWRQVPVDVWMTVPGPTREAIRNNQDKATRRVTDAEGFRVYYDKVSLASSPETRQAFMREDLYKTAFPSLGPTEFKQLVELQAGLRSGDKSTNALLDGVQTANQVVNSTLRGMRMNPEARDGVEAERVVAFRKRVDDEVRGLQAVTGRKATTDEVQQIVDRLAIKQVYEAEWWPDKTVRTFEMNPALGVPTIQTDDQFNALPSGTTFIAPDGTRRVKP